MRVASYNVLADAYIRTSYYPGTPPEVLRPERRRTAIAERVARLAADVVCLQEVEPATLAAIAARLPGYAVHAERKRDKPDAVAIVTRRPVRGRAVLAHDDGTGHVALLVAVEDEDRLVGIAAAHVKWDPPGAAVGLAQAEALLDAVAGFTPACAGWILAGDFNAGPDSPLYARARARGWRDAYEGTQAFTCNSSRVPKRIDFLFHDPALVAEPEPLPPIAPDTALPSAVEPSDHLAIAAWFRWRC